MSEQKEQKFERLAASELFCGKCRKLQPVSKVLLFELPVAEYEFRCFVCETLVGSMTDDDGFVSGS